MWLKLFSKAAGGDKDKKSFAKMLLGMLLGSCLLYGALIAIIAVAILMLIINI